MSIAAEPTQDDASEAQVPTPVRDWLRAKPARPVLVGATLLLTLQLVVRGVLCWRGYFYIDDLAFTGRAAGMSVTDPGYLLHPYNSHLMPGSFAWVSALTALWPLQWAPVVLIDMALQLAIGVVFYRLLRALFGTRPLLLVPFTIAVLSPITLPAFLWWAAALNQLPQQLALVSALLLHVRFLQTGRSRYAVGAALCVAGGLLFSEKTLFTVPLVVAFTLLYAVGGTPVERLRSSMRQHWPAWTAYLVVAVPYAVYYVVNVPSPARSGARFADTGSLVTGSFTHAILPGMIGGPWSWTPIGFAGALAGPGPFARAVALVVVGLVVAGSIAFHRRAAYAWAIVFGYAIVNVVLLAVSRATLVGPLIGQEMRYHTDVALVGALALGLTLMPITGPWRRGQPQLVEQRPWVARALARPSSQEALGWLPRPRTGVIVLVVVSSLSISSLVSSVRYDRFWQPNPTRPYLQTAEHEFARARTGLVLYDQNTPPQIAWALLGVYARESRVFSPLSDEPHFLQPGQTTPALSTLDDSGAVRTATMTGYRNAPGPARECGWLLGRTTVVVPLQHITFPGTWVVRIGYISSADTTLTVDTGAARLTVPFAHGLGAVWFLSPGPMASLQFSTSGGTATVCTDDVTVGLPQPVPGSG